MKTPAERLYLTSSGVGPAAASSPCPASTWGRPRTIPDRACLAGNVFMAIASTPWRLLPACSSPATYWRRLADSGHRPQHRSYRQELGDQSGQRIGVGTSLDPGKQLSFGDVEQDGCAHAGRPLAVARRASSGVLGWWRGPLQFPEVAVILVAPMPCSMCWCRAWWRGLP